MSDIQKIRIGTRGSPLALTQAAMVRAALEAAHPGLAVEVVVIKTTGDWRPEAGEARLAVEAGGKASFAKEIEEALLAGEIDAAVHSMKDMETFLPEGLCIPCMLPREDARDCLLFSEALRDGPRKEFQPIPLQQEGVLTPDIILHNSNKEEGGEGPGFFNALLGALPKGAIVGTASVRRQAFLLNKRPDLTVVPLRGNVQTRIEKVRGGQVDVTLLALAGLKRLGIGREADVILAVEEMLPAAGQGAVGIEVRANDNKILAIISQINCEQTLLRVSAERAALFALDGSCHTPIGAHAILAEGRMVLRVAVATLDGSTIYEEEEAQAVRTVEEAETLGRMLGQRLKDGLPSDILEQKIV